MRHLTKTPLLCCVVTTGTEQSVSSQKYVIFEENDKLGLVDLQGNVALEAVFDSLLEFPPYFDATEGEFTTIYDQELNVVFRGRYDHIRKAKIEGQYAVENAAKRFGVITDNEEIIIPFEYDSIFPIENGYIVKNNKKEGFFSSKGEMIIPIQYRSIIAKEIDENIPICVETTERKVGFINIQNEWIIAPIYDYATPFQKGFAHVGFEKGGDYDEGEGFYINTKGEKIVEGFSNMIDSTFDHPDMEIISVRNYEGSLIYDFQGKLLDTYDSFISNEVAPFFAVKRNNKWGYIDAKGKLVIPLEYDLANNFGEGLAPVCKNGKWGYVNLKNEIVIPFQFEGEVEEFKNGVAKYRKNAMWRSENNGLINRKGEVIVAPENDYAFYVGGNAAIVVEKDIWYLYDFVEKKYIKLLKSY
ncbi:WG repeat-containing protein [Capnocytophaga sputigena]|uniref:WG repeat-containing protein n=1 Tax=Capnocytophaga sputigena TaxID=1019 RepID=UPI0028E4CCDD|nr:WG repeat-containing protein [Capnocytophaga sputigena]